VRIALVNDLKIALAALRKIVTSIPGAEVAWTAEDGQQAVHRCKADIPDLILMDMIMPVMDGVEATRRIMQESPCPIVVVTATVEGNAARVYEALGHGALDAVNTPVLGTDGTLSGAQDLIRKIRTVQRLSACSATPTAAAAPVAKQMAPRTGLGAAPLVAIGASTGGPQALVRVLSDLPRPLWCAVAIVQHVDPAFGPGLANWLADETRFPVSIAQPDQPPAAGQVCVACTVDHLILDARGRYRYVCDPKDHVYRPSVDVFFNSLLDAPVAPGAAVLLTGMGRDGANGLLALKQAGWHTIAQDEATSVVWGMPGAASKLGAASATLPIDEIGKAVRRQLESRRNTN
jgi:two-component system response regulator WspF